MGELLTSILAVIYISLGLLYTLISLTKFTFKPITVGDVILRILFIPFTLIMYIVWLILFIAEHTVVPMLNSKWWNKKI